MTRVVVGHRPSAAHTAGRLAGLLRTRFGRRNVQLCSGGPDSGDDPGATATAVAAVRGGDVLVVLIDRSWRTAITGPAAGTGDLAALAIRTALTHQVPMVVVLVDGAALPGADDLLPPARPPVQQRPLPLDHATFRTDVESIVERIGSVTGRWRRPTRQVIRSDAWRAGLPVSPARMLRRVLLWWAVFLTAALSAAAVGRLVGGSAESGAGFALVEVALFGVCVAALRREIGAQRHAVAQALPGAGMRAARRPVSRGRVLLLCGLCAALATVVGVNSAN